jgi:GNAT superfamily N-acetyltransferase
MADIDAMIPLIAQLGYPAGKRQLQTRLHGVLERSDHSIWLAETPKGQIVGWIHVYLRRLLVTDLHAALGGIVVQEDLLRQGIGRQLLEAAEAWARKRSCSVLRVNTNVIREGAQGFYLGMGYSLQKTQNVYVKSFDLHPP